MVQLGVSVAVILIAWIVLNIIADWFIFKKAKKPGWHCLIPFLNTYDEYDICWSGNMGILYTLLMFGSYCIPSDNNSTMLTFAASVLGIALLVIHMIQSIKLAACFGKGRLYGVFLFCFGGIARIILGLGDAEYIGRVE